MIAGSPILAYATLVVDGLVSGIFIGSALVEHAARVLPFGHWTAYRQAKERVFGAVMPPLMVVAIALPGVAALTSSNGLLYAAAVALLLAALLVTVAVHLPLNRQVMGYAVEAPPADWVAVRQRWQRGNWVRTMFAIAGFACCAAASLGTT